ncbi:metal-sensing transcriptional repressor, partial [Staphylococcus warneri]|uniref:metal-sensing transcriptional repressor n=1 Tax=Staphylococcus warneri TaxID=1292 RepID=UPI0021B3D459
MLNTLKTLQPQIPRLQSIIPQHTYSIHLLLQITPIQSPLKQLRFILTQHHISNSLTEGIKN